MDTTTGLVLASVLQLSQSAITYKQWKSIYYNKKEKRNGSGELGVLNFLLIYENWVFERFCAVNFGSI